MKVMEAEVDKLRIAFRKGDMTGIVRGHRILRDQLDEYFKDLEADEEGGVTSDPSGKWREAATHLTKDIFEKVGPYTGASVTEKEDALGPLRRAVGKVADLNGAIARMEDAPRKKVCERWGGS